MKNEGCFVCFSVNPCMSASRWPRLLKLKRKKNYFKIIIGFFFTPPLLLATKVAISFVYCSPKTIKCTQKPKIEKRFTGIDQSSERASECHSPHLIYNSLLHIPAIHELKTGNCYYYYFLVHFRCWTAQNEPRIYIGVCHLTERLKSAAMSDTSGLLPQGEIKTVVLFCFVCLHPFY